MLVNVEKYRALCKAICLRNGAAGRNGGGHRPDPGASDMMGVLYHDLEFISVYAKIKAGGIRPPRQAGGNQRGPTFPS
jgi:hypothetical protein